MDSSGKLYIADTFNHTIRVGTPSFVMPSIATQPVGQTIAIGSALNLSITAAGTGPFTYQWIKDGAAITGATNATYSVAAAQLADGGTYSVVATGTGGSVTSASVTVVVNAVAPAFTTNPSSQTVTIGDDVTFSVAVTGNPTPTLQWRFNGSAISGANGASLTLISVSGTNAGSYDAVATNAGGSVTSSPAVLTVNTPPPPPPPPPPPANVAPNITTNPASQTVLVGQSATFTVAATGTPSPSYQWRKNNTAIAGATSSSLTIATATLDDAGSYDVVVSNVAGSVTSSSVTLTVDAPPVIVTSPQGATAKLHQAVTFSVVATGSPAPNYQWLKNGAAISGATQASLSLSSVVQSDAGGYSVLVTNRAGSATSSVATLVISAPPTITAQPKPQIVQTGGSATFTVAADTATDFQWRMNGAAISGATSTTLTLGNVSAADAATYDVVATNPFGSTLSSPATLTVSSTSVAPVITAQPASVTVAVGDAATLTVAATGIPAPAFQWRKDGAPIAGATAATLQIATTAMTDAGAYDVVVSNSAGTVTSNAATLKVLKHSYAGEYFGTFASGGSFALYVRADNTGILLAYLAGSSTPYLNASVTVDDSGHFTIVQDLTGQLTASTAAPQPAPVTAFLASPPNASPTTPAATTQLVIDATIGTDGSLTGTASGAANSSLSATRTADAGPTAASAGYYTASSAGSSSVSYTIVDAVGKAFVLTQAGATSDAGTGTVNAAGQISVVTVGGQTVSATVSSAALSATITDSKGQATSYSGISEALLATQRLVNVSSRARASTGEGTVIAGFIISGEQSKSVLIRAVGPTLPLLGVANPVPAPKLDLYRDNALIASNSGWTTGGNASEIIAAAAEIGAFALQANSTDSALFVTLPPGQYTAQMSSGDGPAGIGLVEVYDISAPVLGQKLVNISTRAIAGTGDNCLIAGLVISGTVPKRVLIRAVGPTLTELGVSNVAAQPQLVIYQGSSVIARVGPWSASTDSATIAAAARQVGAFPLPAGSQDAATVINLAPGNYSAQVISNPPGAVLVEVYELP